MLAFCAMADDPILRTRPAPTCPVCGGGGLPSHEGLEDRLFGAPGTWSLRRCDDAGCGCLWLDPAPLAKDLPLAYRQYYTHVAPPRDSVARRIYWTAARAWLARRWGYAAGAPAWPWTWLAAGFDLSGARRAELEQSILFLRGERPGRVLDVGCGEGARLVRLRDLGWSVAGIDLDPAAVARAREKGLEVHLGELANAPFGESEFDAITLSHVIEHVPDPGTVLAQCRRVLSPGGQLVVVTPNAGSLGHLRFGARWRGLEPPRHLQIFTPPALASAVARAGFAGIRTRTVTRIAGVIARESLAPESVAGRTPVAGAIRQAAAAFAREERARHRLEPGLGEEIVLEATLQAPPRGSLSAGSPDA